MATTKLKLGIAAIIATGAIGVATHEHQTAKVLQAKLTALDPQTNIPPLIAYDTAVSPDENEINKLRAEHLELMRLRAEVTELRKKRPAPERTIAVTSQPTQDVEPSDPVKEANKTAARARMNYIGGWGIAFVMFAEENGGMMPKTFAEAAKHYPALSGPVMSAFDPDKFEIVFTGSLKDVPPQTILVREKSAFPNGDQSGFLRTYLFADGHSEIHSSPDGNYEDWEKSHMVAASPQGANQ